MVQFLSQPVSSENIVAHSQQCLRTHHTISTYKFSIKTQLREFDEVILIN